MDPFQAAVQPTVNPFDGVTSPETSPSLLPPKLVDQTARMAAISMAPGEELLKTYQSNVEQFSRSIENSGDNDVRTQIAAKQQAEQLRSISSVISNIKPDFDPDGSLRAGARLALDQNLNEDIEKRKEYSLEKATLENIQNLAAQGDYTQAKILMNHVTLGDPEDIIQNINIKKMIINREVQKAQVGVENEPWFMHAVDAVSGFVGDLTLNNSMDRNNIMDIDKGLKHWFDWIISGNRQRTETAALWDKNPSDFAKAVREQIIPRIKDHSTTMGYTNKSEELNLLAGVANTPASWKTNIGDAVALAGILPFTKIGKVASIPYVMLRSGARKEAAEAIADTTLESIRSGTQAAEKATGITTEEVVENTLPKPVNTTGESTGTSVGLTGDVLAAYERGRALIANLPRLSQGGRLTEAEMRVAVQKERERLTTEIGRPLKDFTENDVELADGSKTTRFEFMIGKEKSGGYLSESAAKKQATRLGFGDAETIQDEAGQWFIKASRDMNENGFATTQLNPGLKRTGIVGRFFLGARQADDEILAGFSRQAANTRNRLRAAITGKYHAALSGVSGEESEYLANAAAWAENKGVWLTRNDMAELFSKQGAKKPPSEAVYIKYEAARDVNDIEFALRTDVDWKSRAVKGFETVTIHSDILPTSAERSNAIINRAPSKAAIGSKRVYDVGSNIHYHKNNPLTEERLKGMVDDGYHIVTMEEPVKLKDGTEVKNFLVKPNGYSSERLRIDQIAYRAGGHRLYTYPYFVKQAVWGLQPDTGEQFLKNPNTYISGTKAEVTSWASGMERARQYYKGANGAHNMELLEEHLSSISGIDAQDFVDMMEDGRLQKDTPFQAMFDRELPEEYISATSPVEFVNLEETGFTGWLRTNGRMYYSSKGDQLHDWQWDKAKTIDPFETTNTALMNIANLASFSDYKLTAVERWVKTYRKYLDTAALPGNASDLTIFSDAKLLSNTDKRPLGAGLKIEQQMRAQQDIIKRNLGWRSDWDRRVDRYVQDMQDGIMGSDPESQQHRLGKSGIPLISVDWWQNKNPLNAARGLAFDFKMGLFNVAQFPLQIQTMVATVALAGPEHAVPSMLNIPFMRLYLTKAGSEATLDNAVKAGMAATHGLEPEAYKQMMRAGKESGFFEFGGTHQSINSYGPSSVTGGFADGWDKFTRAGRFFFNEGEMWNRTVAWQVAWKEGIKKQGITPMSGRVLNTGPDFMRNVALRADDYSMNMMEQSSAAWQHGVASVPTQFWAYNARMLEALVGKQFTWAQKSRLLAAQTFFYGAAGAPLVGVVSSMVKAARGETFDLNTPQGFLDRGVLDETLYHVFGANMLMGKRYGTGTWLADLTGELFGLSPYGDKSFVDIMGGATWSIMGATGDTLLDVVHHVVGESGSGDYPLVAEDWKRMAENVSTYSYAMKALMAMRYGELVSTKGTQVSSDIPTPDAFWLFMGIQPGEQDDIAAAMGYMKNKKKLVDEGAKYVTDHRARLQTEVDNRAEITAEINAFMQLQRPEIRVAILKEANKRTPRSMHEGLAQQMEKEKVQRKILNDQSN